MYLSRYFTIDEPLATADRTPRSRPLGRRADDTSPAFTSESLLAVHPFKTMYAAPLVTLGYKAKIPPAKTHISGSDDQHDGADLPAGPRHERSGTHRSSTPPTSCSTWRRHDLDELVVPGV